MKRVLTRFSRKGAALCLALSLLACGGGGGSDGGGGDLSQDSCGVLGLKIFGGSVCTPASESPVVSFTANLTDGRRTLCSGTLISSNAILTAGHCLPGKGSEVESVAVVVGGQTIAASGFAVHPGYSERADLGVIFSDVGIITLPANVNISPLPLLLSRATETGDIIDIFGYGINEAGEVGLLRSGQMLLSGVSSNHLFAAFGDSGSNTCLGDSGGPALITLSNGSTGIVGLTSTGDADNLCARGDTSVFANTQEASTLQFIQSLAGSVGTI